MDFEYLVFGGGATYSLMYLGVIEEFCRCRRGQSFEDFTKSLKGVAGASAGALIALTICVGVSPAQILEMCELNSIDNIFPERNVSGLYNRLGIDSGSTVRSLVSLIMNEGGVSDRCTMRVLYKLCNIRLVVSVTDVSMAAGRLVDHESDPDALVADIVYRSMTVPGMLEPQTTGTQVWVDGCLSNALPFDAFPVDATLVMRVDNLYMAPNPIAGIDTLAEWTLSCAFLHGACTRAEIFKMRGGKVLVLPLHFDGNGQDYVSLSGQVVAHRFRWGYAIAKDWSNPGFLNAVHTALQVCAGLSGLRSQETRGDMRSSDSLSDCSES